MRYHYHSLIIIAILAGLTGISSAQADDRSYVNYLNTHGFVYTNHPGVSTPEGAIRFGKIICQNLHHHHSPQDRFDPKLAASLDPVMIAAAQHELCPDTLATPINSSIPSESPNESEASSTPENPSEPNLPEQSSEPNLPEQSSEPNLPEQSSEPNLPEQNAIS